MTNETTSELTSRIEAGPRSELFTPEERVKRVQRKALFACLECGHKFYSAASAERASFGDNGCTGCHGSDIDIAV